MWIIIILLLISTPCYAYTEDQAIRAIIGEAESEPYKGKVALAETIRRRGSLKGVYGLNAPRVKLGKYSYKTWQEAKKAWHESARTNYSQKADGWGNESDLNIFKRSKWFKGCYVVIKIGNHYFWKKGV